MHIGTLPPRILYFLCSNQDDVTPNATTCHRQRAQVRERKRAIGTMSSQNPDDSDTEQCWVNPEESVSRAVIALRDFARTRDKGFRYVVSLSSLELDGFLKEFYLAIKDSGEEELSGSENLNRVRADLQTYFLKVANIDISSVTEFSESNSLFDDNPPNKDVTTKGPTMKKHTRQRTFTFDTNELRQIYLSDAMNLDKPETLQNKVFFDVCMYICNRGKDFLRLMTKSDFELSTDQNGIRYVWLKYDSKFSFQEVAGGMTFDGSPGSQIGERMYERKGG